MKKKITKAPKFKDFKTTRATSSALEKILYKQIPILDHGFIRVIDYMGTEQSKVQAARVSYGEGTKKLREDRGLIRYLLSHWHTTPFEMCEIKFHIKLPIFVARQWIRHRTANVNEYSARYSVLDKEFYVPEMDQLGSQSTTNKQGRSNTLDKKFAKQAQDLIQKNSEQLYDDYQNLLNGKLLNNDEYVEGEGLARELARTTLPLNYYTQWYWKVDLHNLMHFLRLRADSHAQYEIQIYAEKMVEILKKWVPLTYEAFEDYRIEGEDYDKFKKTGELPNKKIAPFKQLPVIDVDGKIFAQTGAIARFCGKLSGLYPKNDDYKAALIDQIIEGAQDINYLVTLSGRDKDAEKKKVARDILATRHLPKWFQFLEDLLNQFI